MEGKSAAEVIKEYDKRYDLKSKEQAKVTEIKH
jgi:hypothetical protein